VSFEEAKHLWGKDTVETTAAIQEEKEDRDIEVLCIGPQ
jgi:aldehyde:ferredoxin oxidoreductase